MRLYLRRNTKYYQLMKVPDESIYIVGQPGGAAIALDLLRQGRYRRGASEPFPRTLMALSIALFVARHP